MVAIKSKNKIQIGMSVLMHLFGFRFDSSYGSSKGIKYRLKYKGHLLTMEYDSNKTLRRWRIDNDVYYVNNSLEDFIMICNNKYDLDFKLNY